VQIVSLTAAGRRAFRVMARANGEWFSEMFAGLEEKEIDALMRLLGKAKESARQAIDGGERAAPHTRGMHNGRR
jgi:DNA-binding MarR family transcriptional regulator